ncbi:hypothetical protein [Oceanobacillus sp. CF4.6]|uniref:hypothetical protein n=1 Tax=Oceanobacillus sp. CF4.6 TaxID=3373080 RepID=UPI003EE526ED
MKNHYNSELIESRSSLIGLANKTRIIIYADNEEIYADRSEPLFKKGNFYLIAKEGEELLGWILLGTTKDQFTDQTQGFIYELFVLEEFSCSII